jgi:hypothetical protein
VKNDQEVSKALHDSSLNLIQILADCSPSVREEVLGRFTRLVVAHLNAMDDLARDIRSQLQHPDPQEAAAEGESSATHPEESKELEPVKPTPELLEWARQQINEEEILRGYREIIGTGGLELRDFIAELETAARTDEH